MTKHHKIESLPQIDRRSFIVGTAATGLVIGYAASAIGEAALLPSVIVPASARSVEMVRGFGAQVADGVEQRAGAGEGEAVAREVVRRLVRIPEVRGLHVLAIGSGNAAAGRLAAFAREVAGD